MNAGDTNRNPNHALRVRSASTGQVWVIRPGDTFDVGRDPNGQLSLRRPGPGQVSLARLMAGEGQWWLVANTIGPGIFLDGRRVASVRLDVHRVLGIGNPAGDPENVQLLEFEPLPVLAPVVPPMPTPPPAAATPTPPPPPPQAAPRPTPPPPMPPVSPPTPRAPGRRRLVLPIALAAAGVLALVLILPFLGRGPAEPGGDTAARPGGLVAAKRATVRLAMFDADEKPLGAGSGVVVDESGIILTNAHVAAPRAAGLAYNYGEPAVLKPEVAFLVVGIVGDRDDAPVSFDYRAETVVSDGYLDLAVVRITGMADGSALPAGFSLPAIRVGDSTALNTGDPVTILGFPDISGSGSLTVTTGVVATFSPDPLLSSNRGWIDTDARGTPGNSGGPVINSAHELVGIFAQTRTDATTTVVSGRFRPIELAGDVLAAAKAGRGGDVGGGHLPDARAIRATPFAWGAQEPLDCSVRQPDLTGIEVPAKVAAMFSVVGVTTDMALFLAVRDSEGKYLPSLNRYETSWQPSLQNSTCAVFILLTDGEAAFTAELWADPMGSGPLAELTLRGSTGDTGTGTGTDVAIPGLCAANLGPAAWFSQPTGVGVDVGAALGSDGQPVLPSGRAQFIQPLGNPNGYTDAATADQQAAAAVRSDLSIGRFPGSSFQRWMVVMHGGVYYAIHAQYIPVGDVDEYGEVIAYDQPCLLRGTEVTLVSWHGIYFESGTITWWQYDHVNGAGTWRKIG